MGLAGLGELLTGGAAVCAFNVFSLEHAEGLVAAADATGLGLVLQISQNAVRYHRGLAGIAAGTLAVARQAGPPVAVHLDHVTEPDLVLQAVELGFGSVMYDGSALPHEENLTATAQVVRACHRRGVLVEAELGEVGGKDGVHAPGVRTDPAEAASFVAATGVDALAVAVGSSHAMVERTTSLDLGLIAALRVAVPVPLVLHGSSGVPDDELRRAVAAGMRKLNMATHLNRVFTETVRAGLAADPSLVDSRRYLGPARDALADEAARLLRLLAG